MCYRLEREKEILYVNKFDFSVDSLTYVQNHEKR